MLLKVFQSFILIIVFIACNRSSWFEYEVVLDFEAFEASSDTAPSEAEKNAGEQAFITALKKRFDTLSAQEIRIAKLAPGHFRVRIQRDAKFTKPPNQLFRSGKLELKINDEALTTKVSKDFSEYLTNNAGIDFEENERKIIAHLRKNSLIPKNFDIVFMSEKDIPVGATKYPAPMVLHSRPELTGSDLRYIYATIDQERPVISFETTSIGANKLKKATGANNKGKHLAIVFDQRVISMPAINEPILDGRGLIDGNFTPKEAKDVADLITWGALPVPVKILKHPP